MKNKKHQLQENYERLFNSKLNSPLNESNAFNTVHSHYQKALNELFDEYIDILGEEGAREDDFYKFEAKAQQAFDACLLKIKSMAR